MESTNATGFLLISSAPTAPGTFQLATSIGVPRVRRSTAPKAMTSASEARLLHAIAAPNPGHVLELVKARLLDMGHAIQPNGGYGLDVQRLYEICKTIARCSPVPQPPAAARVPATPALTATARPKMWQRLFDAPSAIPELGSPLGVVLARAVTGNSAAASLEQLARVGVRCTFFDPKRPLFAFTDDARRAIGDWLIGTGGSWDELLKRNRGSNVIACRVTRR